MRLHTIAPDYLYPDSRPHTPPTPASLQRGLGPCGYVNGYVYGLWVT